MENTREMASRIFSARGKEEENCSVTVSEQGRETIILCAVIELSAIYSVKTLIRNTFQKTSHLNCFTI